MPSAKQSISQSFFIILNDENIARFSSYQLFKVKEYYSLSFYIDSTIYLTK